MCSNNVVEITRFYNTRTYLQGQCSLVEHSFYIGGSLLLQTILNDMKTIMAIYGVFVMAYGANIVLSIYKNLSITKEQFSFKKLFKGLIQFAVLILGTLMLVASVDLAISLIGGTGTEWGEIANIASIVVTIGLAIAKYIKEAYTTLQDILNVTK